MMKKGKIKKQSQSHSAYGQFLIDVQQKFAGILEKTCGMEADVYKRQTMMYAPKTVLPLSVQKMTGTVLKS